MKYLIPLFVLAISGTASAMTLKDLPGTYGQYGQPEPCPADVTIMLGGTDEDPIVTVLDWLGKPMMTFTYIDKGEINEDSEDIGSRVKQRARTFTESSSFPFEGLKLTYEFKKTKFAGVPAIIPLSTTSSAKSIAVSKVLNQTKLALKMKKNGNTILSCDYVKMEN